MELVQSNCNQGLRIDANDGDRGWYADRVLDDQVTLLHNPNEIWTHRAVQAEGVDSASTHLPSRAQFR